MRGAVTNVEAAVEARLESGLDSDGMDEIARHRDREGLRNRHLSVPPAPSSAPDTDLGLDTLFKFGLARFLDGVEALIGNRGG